MRKSLWAAAFAVATFSCLAATAAEARPTIVLYEHVDYRGQWRVLDHEVRNFNTIRFNDIVSSFRVRSGVWELCEHADFRGRCIVVDSDDRNIVPRGFNDIISSARPLRRHRRDRWRDHDRDGWGDEGYDRRDRGPDIVLYEHVDYRGQRRALSHNAPDMTRMNFNDIVSSIRIRRGVWEVCEHVHFRGRCLTFDHDVRSLVGYGFNDKMSSVRRLR